MNSDPLLTFVFSNPFLFSALFGALGGAIQTLDLYKNFDSGLLSKKILVGAVVGIFSFIITYDIEAISPALRIALSLIAGFSGSAAIRKFNEYLELFNYLKR